MEEEEKLLDKVTKASEEAVGKKFDEKYKGTMEEFKKEFKTLSDEARKGLIDKATFEEKLADITKRLEAFDAEKFEEFEKTLNTMKEENENAVLEIKKLKENGIGEENKNELKTKLLEKIDTEEFKEYAANPSDRKFKFELKQVSITSNYTGTSQVHITRRDPFILDHPKFDRIHVRDLLRVFSHDMPFLAFMEVYDWDQKITYKGENDALDETTFKMREKTSDTKRIGTYIPLSNRVLKSVSAIVNHILQVLPTRMRYVEDHKLLFGDGAGNDPLGLMKEARDFATIINTTITGTAGAVASVATYDGGTKTKVTFTANQDIINGDKITFASATNAGYNDTFTALVIDQKNILIEEAYVAEADTSAWTFTVSNPFKESVEAAQQIDVLKVANTLVTRQEYSNSGYVIHKDDATKIELLKGNDEHYLDVKRLENGLLTIGGVPVVETTAMPSGKFLAGDFAMAAALYEYTPLIMEFLESTTEKLTNTVKVMIHEEILFPIYNKFMFVKGDFADAITAIKAVPEGA